MVLSIRGEVRHRRRGFRPAALPGIVLALALCLGLAAPEASAAALKREHVYMGSVSAQGSADIPPVLSSADITRYRTIFALQEEGRWAEADREIKMLDDPLLMGRVLFQRYMHPTQYRSRYNELALWLGHYADQPGAYRIYRLAMRRKPSSAKPPRWPGAARNGASARAEPPPEPGYQSPKKRSAKTKARVRALRAHIIKHVRRGDAKAAEKHLHKKEVQRLFDEVEYDKVRVRTAAGYFFQGQGDKAFALAAASAARSRAHVPLADWTAGMAAWRLGEKVAARPHFEALARAAGTSGWNVAAGAFWAARANLVTGRPDRVNGFLAIAARHSRTFYGLVAMRLLGETPSLRWHAPALAPPDMAQLLAFPEVERAIALGESGQTYWAEQEMRAVYRQLDPALDEALLGLASRLDLPAASLRIGRETAERKNRVYDTALYPVPPWEPTGGFDIDRALIYAFMRQESDFNSRAKSRSGARGLMQLLPRTGSFIAKDRSLRGRNKQKLYSPELNIDLGQKYLAHLLDHDRVEGELFKLAAAYNGGPGNLKKWLRRTNHQDDPLLFIESVPSLETRLFIERVLANLWIYRMRLGQETPSLDAVAAGAWPRYVSLDKPAITLAITETPARSTDTARPSAASGSSHGGD